MSIFFCFRTFEAFFVFRVEKLHFYRLGSSLPPPPLAEASAKNANFFLRAPLVIIINVLSMTSQGMQYFIIEFFLLFASKTGRTICSFIYTIYYLFVGVLFSYKCYFIPTFP